MKKSPCVPLRSCCLTEEFCGILMIVKHSENSSRVGLSISTCGVGQGVPRESKEWRSVLSCLLASWLANVGGIGNGNDRGGGGSGCADYGTRMGAGLVAWCNGVAWWGDAMMWPAVLVPREGNSEAMATPASCLDC